MENQQQQPAAAELQRTSVECEPKTLTKEQYTLARAEAAMQVFQDRNMESVVMARAKENEDSNSGKYAANSISGLKFPA